MTARAGSSRASFHDSARTPFSWVTPVPIKSFATVVSCASLRREFLGASVCRCPRRHPLPRSARLSPIIPILRPLCAAAQDSSPNIPCKRRATRRRPRKPACATVGGRARGPGVAARSPHGVRSRAQLDAPLIHRRLPRQRRAPGWPSAGGRERIPARSLAASGEGSPGARGGVAGATPRPGGPRPGCRGDGRRRAAWGARWEAFPPR